MQHGSGQAVFQVTPSVRNFMGAKPWARRRVTGAPGVPSRPRQGSSSIMAIETFGIIGAGQMGAGIAQVASQCGYTVRIHDVSEDALGKVKAGIEKKMSRQVAKGQVSQDDMTAAMARIETIGGLDGFGDADFVIEAATENEEIKRSIFKALVPHLNQD